MPSEASARLMGKSTVARVPGAILFWSPKPEIELPGSDPHSAMALQEFSGAGKIEEKGHSPLKHLPPANADPTAAATAASTIRGTALTPAALHLLGHPHHLYHQ